MQRKYVLSNITIFCKIIIKCVQSSINLEKLIRRQLTLEKFSKIFANYKQGNVFRTYTGLIQVPIIIRKNSIFVYKQNRFVETIGYSEVKTITTTVKFSSLINAGPSKILEIFLRILVTKVYMK
jgi:hypothetical protein